MKKEYRACLPACIRKILCFVLLHVCSGTLLVSAQNNSSSNRFSQNETAFYNRIFQDVRELEHTNPDSLSKFFRIAEKTAFSSANKQLYIQSLYEYALFLFMNGRHEKALPLFEKAMKAADETDNQSYYYFSKTYIGTIHLLKANYNLATNYCLEALAYFESINDYTSVCGLLLNLTYIQIEQNDLEKAEAYALMSYRYAHLAQNDKYRSKALLNIGEIYYLKQAYEKSLRVFQESLTIADNISYHTFFGNLYLNIAGSFAQLEQNDSALYYLEKITSGDLPTGDNTIIVLPKAYLLLSDIACQKGDYASAERYAQTVIELKADAGTKQLSAQAYERLSAIYEKTGEFEKAYFRKKTADILFDSIFNVEKYRVQNEMEALYESSKKQKAIEHLSHQKEIAEITNSRFKNFIAALGFLAVLIVLIAFLLLRHNRIKAKQKALELEQKLLRTQMNPHFIFNSLSSVQDYVLSNKALEASSYLSDFAKLMRAILNHSASDFIRLDQEIETLSYYLNLQHLRLSDYFSYRIDTDITSDIEEIWVPPMLLQPFIENSLQHGLRQKSKNQTFIHVAFHEKDEFLVLETEDNGIGRQQSLENKSQAGHRSKAIDITRQRIDLLAQTQRVKIGFELIDLYDSEGNACGTKAVFRLPLKYR